MKHPDLESADTAGLAPPRRNKPGVRTPASHPPSDSDPVSDLARDPTGTLRTLTLISSGVNYTDFLALDPPLAANTFLELRGLSLLDTFMDLTDGELILKLDLLPTRVADLRAHPHYPTMCDRLKAAAQRLASAATIDGMAEAGERDVARELLYTATHGDKPAARLRAAESLADRRSSKKVREPEQRVLSFPEGMMEVMRIAMEMAGRQLPHAPVAGLLDPGEPAIEIRADRLNVPIHPGDPE
jgi:hypothetical protein